MIFVNSDDLKFFDGLRGIAEIDSLKIIEKEKERIKGKNCWEVQVVKKWWGDWEIESSRAQGTMLEFYPPLPGSLNRQGESGPPTMGSAAPPIPFRPANDNNNAGKVNNFF